MVPTFLAIQIALGLLILYGVIVLAVGFFIGLALGKWIWSPKPGQLVATCDLEWQLSPAQQVPDHVIRDNEHLEVFVFATIPNLPGKHGLQNVQVKMRYVGDPVANLPATKSTSASGIASIDISPLQNGQVGFEAEITIDGQSTKSPTRMFEMTR